MASSIGRLYSGRGGRYVKGDFSALHRMAAQLSRLAIGNQGYILAAGMESATGKIRDDAKSRLKPGSGIDTGALKKSLANKTVQYADGAVVVGIIGPSTGAFSTGADGTRKIRKNAGESGFEYRKRTKGENRPSKYAHLVEFGHRSVHGGGSPLEGRSDTGKGVWNSINEGKSLRKRTISATSYIQPKPFLRPAFDAGISTLETTLAASTKDAMEAEFTKLR